MRDAGSASRRVWRFAGLGTVLGLVLCVGGGGSPPQDGIPVGARDLARVPWEGGPGYYRQYPSMSAWTRPSFLPIAVWFEHVSGRRDVATDRAAGINTYVELTADSSLEAVRAGGSYAIPSVRSGAGPETVAWLLTDEADMMYGPGWDPWSGTPGWNSCLPSQDQGGQCGYTVMRRLAAAAPDDGRPRFANYGKGVLLWQSDEQARVFVNRFQQLVSADLYFSTDPGVCTQDTEQPLGIGPDRCRRSASYGATIDRMRALDAADDHRQPIFAVVEIGHPFDDETAPTITGDQIAGAVMNSIIHEARGVIYFNHSFAGPCPSQHLLRDECGAAVRPVVTETNRRLTRLASVLNTQSYQWRASPVLDTMLKVHGGAYYLFAMPGRDGGEGTQTLRLPAGIGDGRAEVLFEHRSVAVRDGAITDAFASESTVHIYKITP